jgi:hypothetical protein
MHSALALLAGLLALSVIAAIFICCLFTASANRDVDLPAKFNQLDTLPMRSALLSGALSANLRVAI